MRYAARRRGRISLSGGVLLLATLLSTAAWASRVEVAPSFAILFAGQTTSGRSVGFQYQSADITTHVPKRCLDTGAPSHGICDAITVAAFHFANRCVSSGTTVSGPLNVIRGRFSFRRAGVTVTGAIGPRSGQPLDQTAPPAASGTARVRRAGCDSGVLHWRATAAG